tara:strand:- start:2279 stop:2413 length:135 start_codon:yes stop_codon:yes gene_type:complete
MWAPFLKIDEFVVKYFSVTGAVLPEKRRELCSFDDDLSIAALVL